MGKINILDKSIFNRIAAGEVVEKPASVVKELVENSIDSGATSISIEILNGGIKRIRVSDNGCGIEKDDLVKAFLPHATSKITTIDDLYSIGTLGFRGEALASIASVSKVTMTSKIKQEIEGNKIIVEGGEVVLQEPTGCTEGTTVLVEDLFYNVPARAKFLRKEKTEENEITNYVTRLILANPNISIKYIVDNKLVLSSHGNGLFEAIYAVYGNSVVDNLIEFEHKDELYNFYGYLGKPTFSKPNRTYQTLVINGRYVINFQISAAILKAYENFMMKGVFPFYVIHLNLPLDKVDVNVHPNKLDVKFDDNNAIFNLAYTTVIKKLQEASLVKKVSLINEEQQEFKPVSTIIPQKQILQNEGLSFSKPKSEDNTIQNTKEFKENYESAKQMFSNITKQGGVSQTPYVVELAEQMTKRQLDDKQFTQTGTQQTIKEVVLEADEEIKPVKTTVCDQTSLVLDIHEYKVLGTLFNTYILVEQNENLLLIDQHAAHERILYDKFKENWEKNELKIQPLLIPYILELNYLEYDFIKQNLSALKAIGFELEEFGINSYKVNTVPLLLKEISLNAFFTEILKNLNNKLILKKSDALEEYLAKCACKKAVKGNDILSDFEIKILLTKLSKQGQVLLCPHGRPIVLNVTKKEIEKWFKRIV